MPPKSSIPKSWMAGFLVALGIAFTAGVKASSALFTEAEAAPARTSPGLEQKVDSIATDLGAMKTDLAKIKCRLNIDQSCPPDIPVRTSAIGGR